MDGYSFHCPGCRVVREGKYVMERVRFYDCLCAECYTPAYTQRRARWRREVDRQAGVCPGCLAKQMLHERDDGASAFDGAAYAETLHAIGREWQSEYRERWRGVLPQPKRDALIALGGRVVPGSFVTSRTAVMGG
jgi:hypothetical protein